MLFRSPTIFSILLPDWMPDYVERPLVLLVVVIVAKLLLDGNKLAYQLMNILGAFGVLLSLTFGNFNWSAFLLEVAWIAIGVYGIARGVQLRRTGRMVD